MCANQQAALYGFGFMGIGKRDLQERAESAAQSLMSRESDMAEKALARKSRDVDEDMVLCLECCTGDDCNDALCGSRTAIVVFYCFSSHLGLFTPEQCF